MGRAPEEEVSRVSSESPWEPLAGYSRAVRAGGFVFVSGTTGFGADGRMAGATAAAQAEQAAKNVALALKSLGSGLDRVVRTVIYVSDPDDLPEVLAVHRRHFGKAKPAATLVVVKGFVDPKMRIEIEVTALAARSSSRSGPELGHREARGTARSKVGRLRR